MKNNLLKLTAIVLSMAMFTACSGKKNDGESEPDTPDEPALEQVFCELSAADFTKINVPLTKDETASSDIEPEIIDFSGLDFGERLAPCKTAENYEDYAPWWYQWAKERLEKDEYADKIDRGIDEANTAAYEQSLTTPQRGIVRDKYFDGQHVYFSVTYDFDNCEQKDHEWSVFEYDPESGELTEIYNYSKAPTTDEGKRDLVEASGGTLFFGDGIGWDLKLIARDIETGEEKVIYEGYPTVLKADGGNLVVREYLHDGEAYYFPKGYYPDLDEWHDMEYIAETGEWREILPEDYRAEHKIKSYSYNGLFAWLETGENRKVDIVTDYYRIGTDVTNGEIIYTSENMAMFYTSDTDQLHTYNLEKMEYYVTDFSEMVTTPHNYSNGVLFMETQFREDYPYQFIPELGLLIEIPKIGYSGDFRTTNGKSYLMTWGYIYFFKES